MHPFRGTVTVPNGALTSAYYRAAELLNSLPSADESGSVTEADSPMSDSPPPHTPNAVPKDATEMRLEARETPKYLLAKTYFDCREFDRCAAIFLPSNISKSPIYTQTPPSAKSKQKGKAKTASPSKSTGLDDSVQALSQKALFLALYAKYIAGEKRMNEDSKMLLGPEDGGVTANEELSGICAILEQCFAKLSESGRQSQGWLEYLYGIVLAKSKNEALAIDYLIKSVHHYTYNWGAWQELTNLLGTVEEVRHWPMNQDSLLTVYS